MKVRGLLWGKRRKEVAESCICMCAAPGFSASFYFIVAAALLLLGASTSSLWLVVCVETNSFASQWEIGLLPYLTN